MAYVSVQAGIFELGRTLRFHTDDLLTLVEERRARGRETSGMLSLKSPGLAVPARYDLKDCPDDRSTEGPGRHHAQAHAPARPPDVREPLAAVAAVPGADPGAGGLRLPVLD